MNKKEGSLSIPCEIVRGLDGKLYLKSSWSLHIYHVSKELNLPLDNVDGFENGFELIPQ